AAKHSTPDGLNKINGLVWQILILANDTEIALELLSEELSSVREAILQNRLAFDLILLEKGGVCKVLNTLRCFLIPDYHRNISDLIKHMCNTLIVPPSTDDTWFMWLQNLLGSCGHWILTMIMPVVIIGIAICVVPSWTMFSLLHAIIPR
uniref:Uncharacterized protein n=1 Tax=Electrophorus electricus TaxID=8005 RepID=A0A4W4G1A3_ELEEL